MSQFESKGNSSMSGKLVWQTCVANIPFKATLKELKAAWEELTQREDGMRSMQLDSGREPLSRREGCPSLPPVPSPGHCSTEWWGDKQKQKDQFFKNSTGHWDLRSTTNVPLPSYQTVTCKGKALTYCKQKSSRGCHWGSSCFRNRVKSWW